jgi:drug/metabolite transporter (DMT)-like permease
MTPPISRTMGPSQWAKLVVLSIIWGGSFFFFAVAIRELPTFTIVLARVGLGAVALWLAVLALRVPRPSDPKVWRDLVIMGVLNNAIPFSLIVWGQHEVASGLAAVINGTTPFFTVLVANAFTADEKMSWNRLAGALAGLAGVAVMIGYDIFANLGASLGHQIAIVMGAVFYACASVFARRFGGLPPLITAAGQTTGSSLALLPLVLLIDRPWTLPWPSHGTIAVLLALGVLCTAIAYLLYFSILKSAGATNLVLVTFLVPVSAILLGIGFLGESLKLQHLLGMAAIGAGLALIDGRLLRRVTERAT